MLLINYAPQPQMSMGILIITQKAGWPTSNGILRVGEKLLDTPIDLQIILQHWPGQIRVINNVDNIEFAEQTSIIQHHISKSNTVIPVT